MKKTKLIAMLLFVSNFAHANRGDNVVLGQTRIVVGKSYVSTARFSQPITGYERCVGPNPALLDLQIPESVRDQRGTFPGWNAYIKAASQGLSVCKNDYNSDCKIVSAKYTDIVSVEFIGYRACEAEVVVHGYRLN